jgi:hypothetical protein
VGPQADLVDHDRHAWTRLEFPANTLLQGIDEYVEARS